MNKEAGTPGALNKVHRLGTEWEAGLHWKKNQTNQQWVPSWDGTIWTKAGVPALGTEAMRTRREGKHCAL